MKDTKSASAAAKEAVRVRKQAAARMARTAAREREKVAARANGTPIKTIWEEVVEKEELAEKKRGDRNLTFLGGARE